MSDTEYVPPDPLRDAINDAVAPYPIPPGRVYEYGTAGFRMKANAGLDHVVFTVGMIATLRSKKRNGPYIGIMITASHNPADDNGVKLVDPMGDMLEQSWEAYATTLANTPNEKLVQRYYEFIKELLMDEVREMTQVHPRVVFARDTRASGPHLVKALKACLDVLDVEYTDFGLMTTPQLHYVVRCLNTQGTQYYYGEPTELGYYEKMVAAFKKVMYGRTITGHVTVDCANGVGGPKLRELVKLLPDGKNGGIDIKIVNDDFLKPEALNLDCGADFVKTRQRAPPSSKAGTLERCCSLDGDADRIVYYYIDNGGIFKLLDGDRIATLGALMTVEMARNAGIADKMKIGVVQTAYANGASTEYIQKVLKLPVICTPTGVKHLHHAATRFDIGVYFEANGHGTIIFSDNALKLIKTAEPQSPGQKHALESLDALSNLINQAVGDALSDLLFTEVVLAHKCWGPKEWDNTYVDLPNRLVKVEVADRSIFKTTDAERKLVSPPNIQDEIDHAVQLYVKGRAFARASGTEDAVRVYAEAISRSEADDLATKVANLVKAYGS